MGKKRVAVLGSNRTLTRHFCHTSAKKKVGEATTSIQLELKGRHRAGSLTAGQRAAKGSGGNTQDVGDQRRQQKQE